MCEIKAVKTGSICIAPRETGNGEEERSISHAALPCCPFPAVAVRHWVCCGFASCSIWMSWLPSSCGRSYLGYATTSEVVRAAQCEWEGWRAGRGGPPWWGFPGVQHHICHCEGVMTVHQEGIKVMGGEMAIPVFPVTCTCSWLSQNMRYLSKDKPQSLAVGPRPQSLMVIHMLSSSCSPYMWVLIWCILPKIGIPF